MNIDVSSFKKGHSNQKGWPGQSHLHIKCPNSLVNEIGGSVMHKQSGNFNLPSIGPVDSAGSTADLFLA